MSQRGSIKLRESFHIQNSPIRVINITLNAEDPSKNDRLKNSFEKDMFENSNDDEKQSSPQNAEFCSSNDNNDNTPSSTANPFSIVKNLRVTEQVYDNSPSTSDFQIQ